MKADRLSEDGEDGQIPRPIRRHRRERWFAGLTWKGSVLIALLCLLNAVRRNSAGIVGDPLDVWLPGVAQTFGTGLIIALLVTLAVVATYNRVPSTPRLRYSALALAVMISSAAGTLILFALESKSTFDAQEFGGLAWYFVGTWPRYALVGALLAAVFVHVRAAEDSEAATQRAELDRARLAQQMDEARLQMLQAQIEPHFLFNTLANVRRLYKADPAVAESMLKNLMRYLAVALPQMRVADSMLGREAALTESYLNIQRIRMGHRLAFEIDIPTSLRDTRVPPMMMLTLAENAIKHGLNPLAEGGFVRISAQVEGGQLRLRVADSGQGFIETSGGGTGLANIRARLATMYGPAAGLSIELNSPRGVTATIALPYATAVPVTAAA